MATGRVYEEKDNVDDTLLNQISKYVFYDNLWSLARDLEVRETEIRKTLHASSSPQEQIFKVSFYQIWDYFLQKNGNVANIFKSCFHYLIMK